MGSHGHVSKSKLIIVVYGPRSAPLVLSSPGAGTHNRTTWVTGLQRSGPSQPQGSQLGNWRLQGSLALAVCALHNPGKETPLGQNTKRAVAVGHQTSWLKPMAVNFQLPRWKGAQVSSVSTCDATWERWGLSDPGD